MFLAQVCRPGIVKLFLVTDVVVFLAQVCWPGIVKLFLVTDVVVFTSVLARRC